MVNDVWVRAPDNGKTASVIVPDDQLSLAIGREGQNARLAAKLTGWRIDIKSLTEAANEAITHLDDPAVPANVAKDENLIEQVTLILEKKAANRPITAEDYGYLKAFWILCIMSIIPAALYVFCMPETLSRKDDEQKLNITSIKEEEEQPDAYTGDVSGSGKNYVEMI